MAGIFARLRFVNIHQDVSNNGDDIPRSDNYPNPYPNPLSMNIFQPNICPPENRNWH